MTQRVHDLLMTQQVRYIQHQRHPGIPLKCHARSPLDTSEKSPTHIWKEPYHIWKEPPLHTHVYGAAACRYQ